MTPDDVPICAQTDPEMWFPEEGRTDHARDARALCLTCPLVAECLEFALHDPAGDHGIWGGTTERERRAIRRERGILPRRRDLNALLGLLADTTMANRARRAS